MRPFLEIVNEIVMNVHRQHNKGDLQKEFVKAAQCRFDGVAGTDDACEAVREIVANLIGCEQMGIFEISSKELLMRRRWTFGVDVPVIVDLLAHPEFQSALRGKIVAFSDPIHIGCFEEPVSAIVPMPATDTPKGLLLLFRLLPQKNGLTHTDHELLTVIAAGAERAVSPQENERATQE